MSTQENKEIVHRYFDERWNQHNLDIIDELLDPSMGTKEHKEWVRSMYAMLGNIKLTILDMLGEGDQVAIHWQVEAVHQGGYLDVAATGQPLSYQGIAWLRVTDGKIVSDTAYWDNLSILEQLGVIPVTG